MWKKTFADDWWIIPVEFHRLAILYFAARQGDHKCGNTWVATRNATLLRDKLKKMLLIHVLPSLCGRMEVKFKRVNNFFYKLVEILQLNIFSKYVEQKSGWLSRKVFEWKDYRVKWSQMVLESGSMVIVGESL